MSPLLFVLWLRAAFFLTAALAAVTCHAGIAVVYRNAGATTGRIFPHRA